VFVGDGVGALGRKSGATPRITSQPLRLKIKVIRRIWRKRRRIGSGSI